MKRHGNLFEKIAAKDNIHLAYRKARKGKSWQNTVKDFEANLDDNLDQIRESLVTGKFTTSRYIPKTIYEPKLRTIYKLPFAPDRVVQHAIMHVVEPIWDGLMIHDSYSCRQGKGIHAASLRTMVLVKKYRYCLYCDISKFYPSINHDVLFAIVQRKIKCRDTLALLEDIIYSFPGGQNVPIGNYTSQWLGNLYMNELDQMLKHRYHIKGYIRYCDDFLLFHDDKRLLGEMARIIEDYLRERLQLKMSKCTLFPVSQGVDFLGYRHFPAGYLLVRKSTVKRVKKRVQELPGKLATGDMSLDQYRSSLASTIGWLQWANSHNLRKSLGLDAMMEVCDGRAA